MDPPLPFPRFVREYPLRGQNVFCSKPEVVLNQEVKNLIQKLGEAIHESVSESEQIADVVREIREQGFDVLLMLEATIGLNQVEEEAGELTDEEAVEGPFTRNDLSFLKSLRITTEENAGNLGTGEGSSQEIPKRLSPGSSSPELESGAE